MVNSTFTYGITMDQRRSNVLRQVGDWATRTGLGLCAIACLQSCSSSSQSGDGSLTMNLSEAVGLIQESSSGRFQLYSRQALTSRRQGSNLKKVKTDGNIEDVVEFGSASISNFLIAPNGNVFLVFSEKTDLQSNGVSVSCLIATVSRENGTPVCIDSTLDSVSWYDSSSYYKNPAIQLDDEGGIYYRGMSGTDQVLRRAFDGTVTDLINDNISIRDFWVEPTSREVFFTGGTNSTGTEWTKVIAQDGSLRNIKSTQLAHFIKRFPDGDPYFGFWGGISGWSGVFSYSLDGASMVSQPYLSSTGWPSNPSDPMYSMDAYSGDLNLNGGAVRQFLETSAGLYVVALWTDNSGRLFKYYPSFSKPSLSLTRVTTAVVAGSKIVLSGVDASDNFKTLLFDPSAETETQLLDGMDVEIYHLVYSSTDFKVHFDGLNQSNNKVILGVIDLDNPEAQSTTEIGSGAAERPEDFQAF
jgi:hypothetical protein